MRNSAVVNVDGGAVWPELAALAAEQTGATRVAVVQLAGAPVPEGRADAARAAFLDWLRRPDLVSVAVLRASPSGQSLAIAAHCDVVLAAEDAVIAAIPSVEPGLVAALVERVGVGVARSLLLAGRSLSAREAGSLGLIDFLAARDKLDLLVDDVVGRMLSTDRATATELKSLLRRSTFTGIALSADYEARDRLAAGPAVGAG